MLLPFQNISFLFILASTPNPQIHDSKVNLCIALSGIISTVFVVDINGTEVSQHQPVLILKTAIFMIYYVT